MGPLAEDLRLALEYSDRYLLSFRPLIVTSFQPLEARPTMPFFCTICLPSPPGKRKPGSFLVWGLGFTG